MEAIEIDLRERVLRAVDRGESRVATAERFEVSNAWIGKLLRQRRDTGSIAPLPHGGGSPPAVAGEDLEALRAEVGRRPDATLEELRKFLADGRGVRCGPMAVCRALRDARVQTSILMITARDALSSRIEGLDAGADDYLVKPFALDELSARIRAVLRRAPRAASRVLDAHGLRLDTARRIGSRGGRPGDVGIHPFPGTRCRADVGEHRDRRDQRPAPAARQVVTLARRSVIHGRARGWRATHHAG